MATWRQIPLAGLLLWAMAAAQANDPRQEWLQATLRDNNPVREQLAMLGQPGRPLAIRVHRGYSLRGPSQPPLLACVDGDVLVLSEGLLDRLLQLDSTGQAAAGRWNLLYVLAYLGARHPRLQQEQTAATQQQALAMLSAVNQVLASAWEEAGRPTAPAQREQLLQQVLSQVSFARPLQLVLDDALRRDADGFVLDEANTRLLASNLAARSGHAGLE